MGAFYETIPENIYEWILQQKVFWVATAPLSANGHVNVSPKGGEHFGLLDDKTFWYMDLTGSGNETISHLRENGRITVQFNAFTGPPRIVRLWGKGRFLERESPEFDDFVSCHSVEVIPATRTIIVVDIHQVGSSCGYSVPYYDFKDFRKTLHQFFEHKKKKFDSGKTDESMDRYWALKSAWSMDGLPGMQRGLDTGAKEKVTPISKMVGPFAPLCPWGPGSGKMGARVRFRLAQLERTQVGLVTVVFMVLAAFVLGMLVATRAPALLQQYERWLNGLARSPFVADAHLGSWLRH